MDESSIFLAAKAHKEKRHNVQMMHSVLTFDLNHFIKFCFEDVHNKNEILGGGGERQKGRDP